MTTILYLAAAAFSLGLTLRAWAGDRADPVRRAFVVLGALFALYYTGFALFLLPGMELARYLQSGVAAFLPAALLWFLERLLVQRYEPPSRLVSRLWLLAPPVAITFLVVDIAFYRQVPRASPAEVLLAIWCYGGLLLSIGRLWQVHQAAQSPSQRARLRYLLALIGLSFTFTLAEDLLRGLGPVPVLDGQGHSRAAELQGAMPPISTIFTTLFLYTLHQVVQLTRLLDLNEIFGRILTIGAAALLLVLVDGVTVLWLGGLSANPVHGVFQIFLASMFFLAIYDPLRHRIEAAINGLLNARARRLEEELSALDRELSRTLSLSELAHHLLGRLHEAASVPACNLYLYQADSGLYRLAQQQGPRVEAQMESLAGLPFAQGFLDGERAYVRADLARLAQPGGPRRGADPDPEQAALRLRAMEAMGADLCLPLRSGDQVLGWLNLRDEPASDGFSREEIRRLCATVDRAAMVLENVRAVEAIKEQHRLAALGTMAAGLAHEIRNPLAGIKGAAQLLDQERDPELVREFLGVIVDETDRLSRVVAQFLDYARPFELHLEPTSLARIARAVIELVQRAEASRRVELRLEVDEDLPPLIADPDKVRQVLLNLVQNAIQAQPEGGAVRVRVRAGRLRSRNAPPAQILEVEDRGPGVPAEDREKLFIPFFTTRPDGNGLGLAICKRLVEAHGGSIQLIAAAGPGARFEVRLPLQPPTRTLPEGYSLSEPRSSTTARR